MGGVGPPPPSPLPKRYNACADSQLSRHTYSARKLTGDLEVLVVGHSSSDLIHIRPIWSIYSRSKEVGTY
jgi:hypothetical protein